MAKNFTQIRCDQCDKIFEGGSWRYRLRSLGWVYKIVNHHRRYFCCVDHANAFVKDSI